MSNQIFGDIPGYPPGSLFESRKHLSAVGVHRQMQAGISGRQTEGADSIVLSGGYEDDEDHGDIIIYTGAGGRDQTTGVQVHDQPFTGGNRALAFSCANSLPVRVIRGANHPSQHSPPYGYSYDGLFLVEQYWHEIGRSGFRVWRYRLIKVPSLSSAYVISPDVVSEGQASYEVSPRRESRVSRIVRNPLIAKTVKTMYRFRCQVCNHTLDCPSGPYAEASHIRPLGRPHDGPDIMDNLLCLCPNHHVLFDSGAISVRSDLSMIGASGKLRIHRKHKVGQEYLTYHRDHFLTDFE